MSIKNMPIRQHGIEMLNETTKLAACATEVFAPRFQTEQEKITEQRNLDLCILQILRVLP